MRNFGKLDPVQLRGLMLFLTVAWSSGRSLILPHLSPQTATAMGMGGLMMALTWVAMGEMLEGRY